MSNTLLLSLDAVWWYGRFMEYPGAPEVQEPDSRQDDALRRAIALTAADCKKPPEEVTIEDIVFTYRNIGFATWPPEIAAHLAKLPDFAHI